MTKNHGRHPSDEEDADDEAFIKKGDADDSDDWMADEDEDPTEAADAEEDEEEEEPEY